MSKHTYLDAGSKRKKQIYEWFKDIINKRRDLSNRLSHAKTLILSNNKSKSLETWKRILKEILEFNYEGIGQVIQYDINKFGFSRVFSDTYAGIVVSGLKIPKPRLTKENVKTLKLKDLQQEVKQIRKKYYGYNTRTKKRIYTDVEILYNKKTQSTMVKLRDPKTGYFLKQPESLKQKVKELKQD